MLTAIEFGKNLTALREAAGLSTCTLAGKINITCEVLSGWEKGEAMPGLADLDLLSGALGVTADRLLKGSRDNTRLAALTRIADELRNEGIDITSVVELEEYLEGDRITELLDRNDVMNEELLSKLVPFLDEASKAVIFERILDGVMDYRFIAIMLPYAEYLIPQVEAAVVLGAIDREVLNIINNYEPKDPRTRKKTY